MPDSNACAEACYDCDMCPTDSDIEIVAGIADTHDARNPSELKECIKLYTVDEMLDARSDIILKALQNCSRCRARLEKWAEQIHKTRLSWAA